MFGFKRKPPTESPMTAAQWRSRGNAALAEGALDVAADCYRRAAGVAPDDPLAWVNLGYVVLEQKRTTEAIDALQQAVALSGANADVRADAHYLLARAHQEQGRTEPALASLHAALDARPAFDDALADMVGLLLTAGRQMEALECASRAAQSAPSDLAWMLVAQVLHGLGRRAEALHATEQVLGVNPDHGGALTSRGNLLLEMGRDQEALATFQRVVACHGPDPDALSNVAAAQLKLGRHADALLSTQEVLGIQPRHRQALANRGQILLRLLRVPEALDATRAALEAFPADPDLQWNLGVAHLLMGDLAPGWRAHESRWETSEYGHRLAPEVLSVPRWSGRQSLQGRTIVLVAEQGLGDAIQFLRYVHEVARLASRVLLQLPRALEPLMDELPANCRVVAADDPLPQFDLHCPLLSLPHAFGTTLETIPGAVPYLHADPVRVQVFRDRLGPAERKRIGIVWSGNPRHSNDHNRSIPLAHFRAMAVDGCEFVSLQAEVRDRDRDALADWPGLRDFGPQLEDFGDTAALMSCLDLVIAVDTSVAHLAGALGKPVWVLLPYCPDWRWMLMRSDSPWYPTARLYRQAEAGAWAPVLARVRSDLAAQA